MNQTLGLILQGLGDSRMAMAKAAHADTRDEIEVCIALGILDLHTLARNELDRLAGKSMHNVLRFQFLLLF